jgi:hypothetical protein
MTTQVKEAIRKSRSKGPRAVRTLEEVLAAAMCTVPEAANVLGLTGPGYVEAQRGEIPTIKIGRRRFVPTALLKRMINGEQLARPHGEAH